MKFTVSNIELAQMVAVSLKVKPEEVTVTPSKDAKSCEIEVSRNMALVSFAQAELEAEVPEEVVPTEPTKSKKTAPSKAQQAAALVEGEPKAEVVTDTEEDDDAFPAFLSDDD